MAEQGTEQLVIEAVLKDLVSKQAGEIVKALKAVNDEAAKGSGSGGAPAGKGPEEIGKGLTKLVPIARRAGGELLSMTGNLGKFGSTVVGSLREASSVLGEMGTAAGSAGGSLVALGTAAAGLAVVGSVIAITANQAFEFDKALKVVKISANLTADEMDDLAGEVRKFQMQGADAVDAANALAAAFRFLTKDSTAAAAAAESVLKASRVDVGGGNAAELMKSTAAAMKAFGLTAGDTDRVLGILHSTSMLTGDGMAEIASVLAQIAPSAAVAKVSLEDVAATLAVSSDKAGGLGEAAGALSQFLSQVSKPTSKLSSDLRSFGVDTSAGADGLRDLHGILAQIGDLSKQDGGIIEVLSGSARQGNKIFASAADDAAAYYDALAKMRNGAIELSKKEAAISSEDSEVFERAKGRLAVAGAAFGSNFTEGFMDFIAGITGASPHVDAVTAKTEKLAESITAVARAAKTVDLESPLQRQIEDLAGRIRPLMLQTELDPSSKKAVEQDLLTLEAALANRAALKAGQLDAGSSQALARIAQLTNAIEQAQALSADLSVKTASGYQKQRLELEAADAALGRTVAKLELAGIKGSGFLSQARAVIDEMRRAANARTAIEGLTLQGGALQAQRQRLTSEMALADARGDYNEAAELTVRLEELEGRMIELNAARARAANLEQYRGRSDLLDIAQKTADATRAQAEAELELARIQRERLQVTRARDLSMQPGQQRLDELLDQRALDRFHEGVMTLHEAVLSVRTDAAGIADGFREGMDDVLRAYSDSAQRMFEVGQEFIRSFHDEGTNALSDFAKGKVSGKDALKQFGKGVLGNVIDSSSSRIMDSLTGGLFGSGHGSDKEVSIKASRVTIVTNGLSTNGGMPGLFPDFMGGLFPFARGGVIPGGLPSFAGGGGITNGPRLAMIGDNPSRAEAVVPLPGANRGIPVEFRGGGRGRGGVTVNQALSMQLTVHSVDPRGAADVVLAQMPQIQKAITSALLRGSDRALRDAVQGAAR